MFSSVRRFSTSSLRLSHVGSEPVYLTQEVSLLKEALVTPRIIRKGRKTIKLSQKFVIKGPKGEVELMAPEFVEVNENGQKLEVSVRDKQDKIQRSIWGTVASTLRNHVTGVTEGHLAILKLVGTGYRAAIIDHPQTGNKFVSMKVGSSILQGLEIPEHLNVTSPVPTRVIVEGMDKQQVKLFAAKLRSFHPPEPYKGKGVYVDDETIKIKDKKIK